MLLRVMMQSVRNRQHIDTTHWVPGTENRNPIWNSDSTESQFHSQSISASQRHSIIEAATPIIGCRTGLS